MGPLMKAIQYGTALFIFRTSPVLTEWLHAIVDSILNRSEHILSRVNITTVAFLLKDIFTTIHECASPNQNHVDMLQQFSGVLIGQQVLIFQCLIVTEQIIVN